LGTSRLIKKKKLKNNIKNDNIIQQPTDFTSFLFFFENKFKRYKKYILGFLIFVFIFGLGVLFYNHSLEVKKKDINMILKTDSNIEELKNKSPILYELYTADNNLSDNQISEYNSVFKSNNIDTINKYLKKDNALFKDLLYFKLSELYLKKNLFDKAIDILTNINITDTLFIDLKETLISQIEFKKKIFNNKKEK
jgi:hypothetical protein